MQGGGYNYGGGGMGNGNANGNGAGNQWSRGNSYMAGEETSEQMMSPQQQNYQTEQQRVASPLPNVSSGYAPRNSTTASPMSYSPTMQQNSAMGQTGIPPLNLTPQYPQAGGRSSVAASPVTETYNPQYMYNQVQYGNNNNNNNSNQYQQQYQNQSQYGEPMGHSSFATGGDLKHRGVNQGHEWTTDGGNGYSSPRKTFSPAMKHGGYDNGNGGDYGYPSYGGMTKKNRFHNFFMSGNLRYLLLLLIPSLWLLFNAMKSGGSVSMYPSSGKFDIAIGEKDLEKLGNGISIVGACMNRQEKLEKVLKNWLSIKDAKEIILVDWSSDPPLKTTVDKFDDKRLKLVRVDDEEKWVLSRAFNVGMQFASYEKIIRLDCDYALAENFTNSHQLEQGKNFFSGNWEKARNENEIHLNGAMHVHQKDFWKVMGYDERIQTYGWDDEDMYTRLANNAKLDRITVNYDDIIHFPHDDSARAQDGVKFVEVETDYNRIMLEKLPVWGPDMTERSAYEVQAEGNFYELKATKKPLSVANLTDESGREQAWSLALGRRLHDEYTVPWDMLGSIAIDHKELLLRRLMAKTIPDKPTPKIVYGHCMHGLGNRLRALGSIMSYAKNTNKELVVIWENDEHCGARFDDLFSDEIVQMAEFNPQWPFTDNEKYDQAWGTIAKYNYMELEPGANKGEIIKDDPEKHTYYKGAYIMEAPGLADWEQDNENLRSLTPHPEVQKILDEQKNKDFGGFVGVHIRNRDLSKDIQNVDFSKEYTASASDTMDYWRHKSHYKNFIDRMRQLLVEDPNLNFYVASDTFEIQKEMEQQFPGRIFTTERSCDDRDSSCVRYALADLYNLGKTKKMLGSNWSSFTEAAQRLGGIQAELAGQDFAVDPNGPPAS